MMNRFIDRKTLVAVEPLSQRFALNVGHHVVEETLGLPGIVKRQNVRVIQSCRELYFAKKPVRAEGRREVRVEHFESDKPLVLAILRQVHRGHSATAQLTVYRICL